MDASKFVLFSTFLARRGRRNEQEQKGEKGRKRKKKRTRTKARKSDDSGSWQDIPRLLVYIFEGKKKGKLSSPLQNDHEQASLQVTVLDQKLEMRWSLLLHCGNHLVVASKKKKFQIVNS